MRLSRIAGGPAFAGLVTLLALAIAAPFGCATNQPVGEQLDDAGITAKVKAKLAADPQVNPFEIDVDTQDGVVRLSGMVENSADRAEAEKLARNTNGVRSVRNDIKIGDKDLGDHVSDDWITTKIKTKLTANAEISPFNVDVDVQEGVVTLSGKVKNSARKQEAEEIARNTKGVRGVKNLLEVGD